MSFPQTRHTLIQRIVLDGSDTDWRQFLKDYWEAVCRFARYAGRLSESDAEDVASQTFEAILQARLLERWTESRSAKLRTLICAVVRNILSNRSRTEQARTRLVQSNADQLTRYFGENGDRSVATTDNDLFHRAWVESLVHQTIEHLLDEYNASGRGDYFRVLHGRICEQLTISKIASALEISPSAVDNYFRHARRRLSEILKELVHAHLRRYSAADSDEFEREWQSLFETLNRCGGLEAAIRQLNQVKDA